MSARSGTGGEVAPCIWVAAPAPRHLDEASRWLSEEERSRLARMRSHDAAMQYAAGHALLRRVLSQLAGDAGPAPRGWSFVEGPHGRPELDRAARGHAGVLPGLTFNLSHTHGLVAVGVAGEGDLGVDVEYHERTNDLERLAEAKFAASEYAALSKLDDPREWRRRFFLLWTLKEAFLKALGAGLTLPLREFAFDFPDERSPRIAISEALGEEEGCWSFGTCGFGTGDFGMGSLGGSSSQSGAGSELRLSWAHRSEQRPLPASEFVLRSEDDLAPGS